MDASAKVFALDKSIQQCGEWTVVLPRRGRGRRKLPALRTLEEQPQLQPWCPADVELDPDRQSKLMQKMQASMEKVERSVFFKKMFEEFQTGGIWEHFRRVLGSEVKMQMVIYGIGSIESYETPRFQLSVALLLKKRFSWIGDIEVFDPILSATESRVLEAFGCSVLSINEQGRRQAIKPTLFYMPHCEAQLYDNLLRANWKAELLNQIVLFGNSFQVYQHMSNFSNSLVVGRSRHIFAATKFTDEYVIDTVSDDYFAAFHDSSWHFFSPDLKTELQIVTN
ncbi:hypothetical protein Tsubulata_025739 [Turnera subulata]|uniref:SRR1-like domain-containing protein n=1 Tax=Turnera subulata TaxID=218843 RepID=A0A9Q0J7Q2_9ROSI|nr:hypothetical protein Tsubulata_025739 [Turnera subulata]